MSCPDEVKKFNDAWDAIEESDSFNHYMELQDYLDELNVTDDKLGNSLTSDARDTMEELSNDLSPLFLDMFDSLGDLWDCIGKHRWFTP